MKERRQQEKETKKKLAALRKPFMSKMSEMISHAKLMAAYFNFMNEGGEQEWTETEARVEVFAEKWYLRAKALKEVHLLCLQLEKIMKEDVLID